jgi:hypothetical protein
VLTETAEAKRRALQAHKVAKTGDARMAAVYDRWLADTLLAAGDARNQAIAEAMFTRLAIALEVMVDMRGWGQGVVAGLTAPRRASRLQAGG